MSARKRTLVLTSALAVLLAGATASAAAPPVRDSATKTCKRSCEPVATQDVTAPSVAITAPGHSATVAGTVTVVGSAADDSSGVAHVDVQVDGGAWHRAGGTADWSWTWSTSGADDGTRTLTARATDLAGNVQTVSRTVTVSNSTADTAAPAASFSSPAAGATVSGTTTVTGTASDDRALASVEIRVDSGAWSTVTGTTSWSWSWSTGGLADGTRTLTVRATDTAGNVGTASRSFVVSNATSSPSTAPDAQGTWTSPEGVEITVESAGGWTINKIYTMLRDNALAPGDFARIAPTLTVWVQDTYPSSVGTSVSTSGGATSFRAQLTLKGVSSSFATQPDAQLAHEYGHVWTLYHLSTTQNGDWSRYLQTRWASSGGTTVLGQDSRLDSSYTWDRSEIIADDYRLLFGTPAAVAQRDRHMNPDIPDPRTQTGLRSWFLSSWAS